MHPIRAPSRRFAGAYDTRLYEAVERTGSLNVTAGSINSKVRHNAIAAPQLQCKGRPIKENAVYMVYWSEHDGSEYTARSRQFDTRAMNEAMQFMEALRSRQRNGDPVRFISMASEHPDSVGQSGVAEAGPDYNWKKRRR